MLGNYKTNNGRKMKLGESSKIRKLDNYHLPQVHLRKELEEKLLEVREIRRKLKQIMGN